MTVLMSSRERMRIKRKETQAMLEALFNKGYTIGEACAESGVDYSAGQRANVVWRSRKTLADRQRAQMPASVRLAAEITGRRTAGELDQAAKRSAPDAAPAPAFAFDPSKVNDIVATLNATLGANGIQGVMPDETPED